MLLGLDSYLLKHVCTFLDLTSCVALELSSRRLRTKLLEVAAWHTAARPLRWYVQSSQELAAATDLHSKVTSEMPKKG